MKEFAERYYDLGLTPTCISFLKTKYNMRENNPEKSPCHSWTRWQVRRPTKSEILKLDWNNSNGIGTVLGYTNRCIDIDNCNDYNILKEVLIYLALPKDYEWVIKTPNGFHIYISASNIKFATNKQLNNGVLALSPNKKHTDIFSRIELRWANHGVLPPTVINNRKYKFINDSFPKKEPKYVNMFYVFRTVSFFCGNYYQNFGNFEINNMIFQISAPSHCDVEISAAIGKLDDEGIKKATLDSGYIDHNKLNSRVKAGFLLGEYPGHKNYNLAKPLFIDIETTGLIKDPVDYDNYPRIIQLAYSIGRASEIKNYYIKPDDFSISNEIERLTGITNSQLTNEGVPISEALMFNEKKNNSPIIAHNIDFDISILDSEYLRLCKQNIPSYAINRLRDGSQIFCLMKKYTSIFGGKYPKLGEMYSALFGDEIPIGIHDAKIDLEILIDCYYLMNLLGYIKEDYQNGLIE